MADNSLDSRFCRILVALETDATRYYGSEASRPAVLGASDAEQMLAHIAADLGKLLPGISDCRVIAAGALFDQTQILRPGYPAFAALESAARQVGFDRFKPGLVSIGTRQGHMPSPDLAPLDDIPLGLLQILPIVVQGPSEQLAALAEIMEYRFLEEGQLSAHSSVWLQAAFGISIQHARLMTLTDLNALLRMQLEHFGFLPLWELLDAAIGGDGPPLAVTIRSGQPWEWRAGAVHTTFETFDYWANEGCGAGRPAGRMALAADYADWTREMRQYLTTLRSHGVDVEFHLPGDDRPLQGTFLAEPGASPAPADACAVTEHHFDDLGVIAITFADDHRVENYYPLKARGLNEIHAQLRERVPSGHTVAFPGTILYNEATRRLRPDCGSRPEPQRQSLNDS